MQRLEGVPKISFEMIVPFVRRESCFLQLAEDAGRGFLALTAPRSLTRIAGTWSIVYAPPAFSFVLPLIVANPPDTIVRFVLEQPEHGISGDAAGHFLRNWTNGRRHH